MHERVAIGCCLGDNRPRQRAAGARAIFHHHRLPPSLAQLGADHARERIVLAAGGGGHHAYGFLGIILRALRKSGIGKRGSAGNDGQCAGNVDC